MAGLRLKIALTVCAGMLCAATVQRAVMCADETPEQAKEKEAIKAEIELLIQDLEKARDAKKTVSKVDKALDKKAEKKPDLSAKTHDGKLEIGGLVQVWYMQFQRDSRGLFDDPNAGVFDTNDANDNSTFEVRRAQLSFTIKPNAYVTAYVMVDPAAEQNTFPLVTDNQAVGGSIFKQNNNVAKEVDFNSVGGSAGLGNFQTVQNLQVGFGVPNRMLQDAFINFHTDPACPGDFDIHHDFQVGEFIPPVGEEGLRSNAQLDFVERSFVGILENRRDLGAQVHGTWWDDRFQYWTGLFDGGEDYHMSNGQENNLGGANRSDNNDSKDVALRMLVRPLCSDCYGNLELGYSNEFGHHGETSVNDPENAPINGLERRRTWAMRQAAWGYYSAPGILKGLWTRGEWGWFKDRNSPGTIVDFTGNGTTRFANVGDFSGLAQGDGRAFSVQGWYAAAGYRLGQSCICMPKHLKDVEFAFRYQSFQNVLTADLIDPTKVDVFSTRVYTGGVNYYIKETNAKIQLNYNAVVNPEDHAGGGQRDFHNVRNNSFVIAFQVAF